MKKGKLVGTPYYMAPELWNHQPCSKKTDIWALGVILYELCCLKIPFECKERKTLIEKI